MGKKKNKKGKRKRYNKKEFVGIVCNQCCLCSATEPSYCYEIAYKEDPDMFMSNVFPGLINYRSWLDKNNISSLFMQTNHFREVFCHSGICGADSKAVCVRISDCYNAFRQQTSSVAVKDRRKLRKEGQKIFEPYPTFFISEDEGFRKEIEEILSDGDRNIEQNRSEGSSTSVAG
jgi:hypothetical protein